jgi:hypothetical protein
LVSQSIVVYGPYRPLSDRVSRDPQEQSGGNHDDTEDEAEGLEPEPHPDGAGLDEFKGDEQPAGRCRRSSTAATRLTPPTETISAGAGMR